MCEFFQNISFKILFLSSLGHLFIPYKIFPTPPPKRTQQTTHTHTPTHPHIKQNRNTYFKLSFKILALVIPLAY